MIRAAQLETAAAGLGGLAARLGGTAARFSGAHRRSADEVGALGSVWGGPLPDKLGATTSDYLAAVDGRPVADVVAVVEQWASAARVQAEVVRALESRRASTAHEMGRTSAASLDEGVDDPDAAEERRHQLAGQLASIDRAIEDAHRDWTQQCSSYAGTVDTFTRALRTQAGVSAIAAFAVEGVTLASFSYADVGAWLATLSDAQIAALLADASAAEAWWDSLSEEDRIAFVAGRKGNVPATLVADVDAWKDTLDSDGLRALYTALAMAKAGIDPAQWNPALGFAANAATVHAVYDYYSSLYLTHPDTLWWAGMASMIGPSFVAGMADLSDAGTIARAVEMLARAGVGPEGIDDVAAMGASELAAELRFYEVMLLRMQREIFLDMAVAHEAYLDGGMDTIERLYADDPYQQGGAAIEAWRKIDEGGRTGDQELVAEGNRSLLLREQLNVIDDDYRAMLERPVTGEVFTYVFTAAGSPSIPGAVGFAEQYPIEIEASQSSDDSWFFGDQPWLRDVLLPFETEVTLGTATPLPDGNVAVFEDRWKLIEEDTLPVYLDLVTDDPAQVTQILSTPVADRVDEWRIVNRIDDIITNWEPYVEVDVREDGSVWGTIGDAWNWATGGGDSGPTGPVEVPTGTTTTTPSPAPEPTPTAAPEPDPAEQGPTTGTTPSPTPTPSTTVPGG